MKHVRSAAFMIHQEWTTRCVIERACYSKRNIAIRLNATVPSIKSAHFVWTRTSSSPRSSGVLSSWRGSLQTRSIGLGINGTLATYPTTIPNRRHLEKPRIWIEWHFVACSKFHENFYIVSEVILGDMHVDSALLLVENSGLDVLSVRCPNCTWSKNGCLLSVAVSSL